MWLGRWIHPEPGIPKFYSRKYEPLFLNNALNKMKGYSVKKAAKKFTVSSPPTRISNHQKAK
jgi:hypothetical protein